MAEEDEQFFPDGNCFMLASLCFVCLMFCCARTRTRTREEFMEDDDEGHLFEEEEEQEETEDGDEGETNIVAYSHAVQTVLKKVEALARV